MNLKMMIADDEKIIREGIRDIVDWKSYGIEVVGVCKDGAEALHVFKMENPDIVITDIKMPNMTGIELIKAIREHNEYTKIIILSGYDEFSYAKEAVKAGVVDYLLKPVLPDILISVVNEAKEACEAEALKKNEEVHLWKQIEENLPVIREKFLVDLIQGYYYEKRLVEDKIKFLNLFISPEGRYYVMIVHIDNFSEAVFEIPEMNKQILHLMILNDILEITKDNAEVFSVTQGEYALIMDVSYKDNTRYINKEEELAQEIRKKIQISCKLGMTIGIGNLYDDVMSIQKSFSDAKEALKYRLILGNDQTIRFSDIKADSESGINNSSSFEDEAAFIVRNADMSRVDAFVDELFTKTIYRISPAYVKWIIMRMIFSISIALIDVGENMGDIIGSEFEIGEKILNCETTMEMKEVITSMLNNIIDYLVKKRNSKNTPYIDLAMKYLNEHYAESFSLKKLADAVHLSPNYICGLFKQETGQNISDYLMAIRIEKVKELLKNPKYKVYEIADMVGYADSRYLSNLFKKHTGMGIAEYKQLNY